ncbi:hypothetical protein BCV70DRAFT_175110, partial [Testicularia cyperi]
MHITVFLELGGASLRVAWFAAAGKRTHIFRHPGNNHANHTVPDTSHPTPSWSVYRNNIDKMTAPPVRIVATGGHSGLGFEAIKTLLGAPVTAGGCHLILFARDRNASHVQAARRALLEQTARLESPPRNLRIDVRSMDLASLASVRLAASELRDELLLLRKQKIEDSDTPASASTAVSDSPVHSEECEQREDDHIDIILLNAALAKAKRESVVDTDKSTLGYPNDTLINDNGELETTACVNHVAHLVFLTTLAPVFTSPANTSSKSHSNARTGRQRRTRIVFTGSELHRSVKDLATLDAFFAAPRSDFESGSGSGSGSGLPQQTAQNHPKWTLRETYAASKFLQMLGIRAFRRKLEQALLSSPADHADPSRSRSAPGYGIEIVIVQPGFVPQTGLARETSWFGRLVMSYLLPLALFTTSLDQAGRYIAQACYPSSVSAWSKQHEDDGFHSPHSHVRAALLQQKNGSQLFATLDQRSADIQLQEKWWPSAC